MDKALPFLDIFNPDNVELPGIGRSLCEEAIKTANSLTEGIDKDILFKDGKAFLEQMEAQALNSEFTEDNYPTPPIDITNPFEIADKNEAFQDYGESIDINEASIKNSLKTIRAKYYKDILDARDYVFGQLPISTATKRRLITMTIECLARRHFIESSSGVVISGFGESEYIPQIHSYQFQEMILNKPRYREESNEQLSPHLSSKVVPFAQDEMVYSFMQGIDESLEQFMQASTLDLFNGVVSSIIDSVKDNDKEFGDNLEESLKNVLPKIISELFTEWEEEQQTYWQPVVEVVSILPKDELAIMAENLVNLTKFRRRVTTSLETVGGPIDIAIITKGDGFIWYKRKHYFDPEHNPRAIAKIQGA
jgi:hypothetical protein